MASLSADQFDPIAGNETTLAMVSGLPRRIAKARIQAAAMLANEALDRARIPPSDCNLSQALHKQMPVHNAAIPDHANERFRYGGELTIISFSLVAIAAGMLWDLLH